MAAPSGDDIPAQLAALLGRDAVQIRKTDESPPRISIIDVARAITGHNADYSSLAVRNVCDQYPKSVEKSRTSNSRAEASVPLLIQNAGR